MHAAPSDFRRSQFFINAILIQDFCEWNHKELGGGLSIVYTIYHSFPI